MARKMNLLLTLTLAVVCLAALLGAVLLPTATPAQAADEKYENTNATSFVASDKQVMLVHEVNGTLKAITAGEIDSDGDVSLSAKDLTLDADGKVDASSVTDNMLWIIEENGSNISIKSVSCNLYIPTLSSGSTFYLNASNTKASFSQNNMQLTSGTVMLNYSMSSYRGSGTTAITLSVWAQSGGAPATIKTYTKNTSGTLPIDKNFVVAYYISSSNTYWIMVSSQNTSYTSRLNAVKITDGTVDSLPAASVTSDMLWQINSDGDITQNGQYLTGSGSTYNNTLSMSGATSTGSKWTFANNKLTNNLLSRSIQISSSGYSYLDSGSTLVIFEENEDSAESMANVTFASGNSAATGEMNPVSTAVGDYTLPECGFTYPLHKFAGWKVNGEGETLAAGATVSIAADTEFVAQWEENWWNVTIKMDGQTDHIEKVEKSKTLSLGNNTTWWADSTPAGKIFSHWTSNGEDKLTGNYTPSADVTLTAVFADAVTVKYDLAGGTSQTANVVDNEAKTVVKGSSFTVYYGKYDWNTSKTIPAAVKDGYIFLGWQMNDENHTIINADLENGSSKSVVINQDTTFTAIWGKEQCNINFVVNENTTTKTVKNGQSFDMSLFGTSNPSQSGKIFVGWLNSDNELVGAEEQFTATDDMTFTASFRDPEVYTVTLHYGSTTKQLQFVEDTKNIQFNASTFTDNELGVIDSDHTFGGWFKDDKFTTQMSTSYLTADDSFENLHLYAKVSAYFHVLFDWGFKANASDQTNIVTDRRAVVGSQGVTALYSESGSDYHGREKYTLLGWATAQGGAVVYAADGRTNVTEPCTLYAVWDYDFYVVTIKAAGVSEPVGAVEVAKNRKGNTTFKINELKDADDKLVISWTALNPEHKDAAWALVTTDDRRDYSVNDSITLTSDVTLEVRFTDHLYTITVSWVGGTLATIKQAYNTDVTAPETDKAGYSFVAFYLDNESGGEYTFAKMPGQDIRVWAKYDILDSTLKFVTGNGGSVIADVVAQTGSVVNKPADPTRDGYEFVKWQLNGKDVQWQVKDGTSANPEYYINMPGGVTTLTAVWNMTEEGKTALKEAKIAELEAYAEELGVQLPDNATTGISNANTEENILAAFNAAKLAVDELKAAKDEELAAASKARVDAAKQAVAALQGKSGTELFGLIKAADTALNALSADEKAQVDLTLYNQAKTAYSEFVAGVTADLEVAENIGASAIAVSFASVAALAALAFVLKRRMF